MAAFLWSPMNGSVTSNHKHAHIQPACILNNVLSKLISFGLNREHFDDSTVPLRG